MSAAKKSNSETQHWLAQAATWRYFSLLFTLPTRQSRAELRRLAHEVPRELRSLGESWSALPLKDTEAEFHRVLGAGGVPAVESSYDDNALAGRGPLLADVRAFYEAFSYAPERPPAELPDHIAVQLDYLAYLAMKLAFAHHAGRPADAQITREACDRFLKEHVCEWVPRFAASVARAASPFYDKAVARLCDCLSITVEA